MSARLKINYDRLGIFTSIACAIHCTLLPLFISSLPFLGIDILEHKGIEWSMIGLAFLFGIVSLYHGYKQHHHRLLPVLLFGAGFSFLILNQLTGEQYIYLFIPLSALCIISAHSLNIVYCRRSGKCAVTLPGNK
ncbi:MAG: MerC domain-containing protein [Agriterribacter sp.]